MFELALVMLRPMYLGAVLFLFTFFVLGPAIAAGIAYAAWKGKPKNFDREMYWTAFAAAILASGFLMVFAQRMQADVRTWKYVAQIACFGIGAVLFWWLADVCWEFSFTAVAFGARTRLIKAPFS
jgi:hypothetical protein